MRKGVVAATILAVFVLLLLPVGDASAQACNAAWAPNVAYATGAPVSYAGRNYSCLQGHTSQVGWEPPNAASLWNDQGACSGAATPTATARAGATATATARSSRPTPTTCAGTAINPYLQVNGGAWQNTSTATVSAGASVKFGPQPASGGSWLWSTGATTREITVVLSSTTTYTATYTNASGCKTTRAFTITVAGTTPRATPTTPVTATPTATSTATAPRATPTTGSVSPLFPSGTALEPAWIEDIGSAIVTHWADRARDRHAREPQFMNYDHYLPLYWEYRTAKLDIIDRVAKGGSTITVNITALHELETPDFRAFYLGSGVLTNYSFNVDSTQLDPLHYTVTIDKNYTFNRPLQTGDRMEIEFSQFIRPPLVGRTNYYGTAVLYIVGQGGLVPWQGQGSNLDSVTLPTTAWLGGRTTLPYNYSNEPIQAFKQTATNISQANIQPFMLGRRLHHTDFGDGTHSEPGNPAMTNQAGKLGPRYAARSCIGCHTNNGRALPPGMGTAGFNVQFYANDAAWADLIYRINGAEQAFRMDHDAATNDNTWIVRNIPGGASVEYRFTIASGGGSIVTPWTTFTMAGGSTGGNTASGHFTLSPAMRYVVKVGSDAAGSSHPNLGKVLQPLSTSGTPESNVNINSWTTSSGTYGDGSGYSLRRPNYTFGSVVPSFYSARIAPQLVGLGLLEAIAESTVSGMADPGDANGDGISGRMQIVTDPQTGQARLGRFGWKGGQARLSHQIASALGNDIGVTTSIFPNLDCGSAQGSCGSGNELSSADLDLMVRYIAVLGVQARRNLGDAQATQGEGLFASIGCTKCHAPSITTTSTHPYAELRSQSIKPYTDLLLHDLGPGLADNMGEAGASGAEWRTAPLWSLGYGVAVSGGESYLHDGRARTLSEAILWHGGEAEAAKEAFRTMSSGNRAALIKFLQSL